MNYIDWLVLIGTQIFIVVYGLYKSRENKDMKSYLLGDKKMSWLTIGLSIMATQASAITFLSTPGQAFGDGLRFVQFYFGMPVATVILCLTAIPIYQKLNIFTAYEFLEKRFDIKTRTLGALLFLVQRGIGAGITIYAPSIILSGVLGWDITWTNICIGSIVIIYTVTGGTKAVSQTQKQQMIIIMLGMLIAAAVIFLNLPENLTFRKTLDIAGSMNRLNAVDFKFDFNDRYNFWSGILAGTFLFLSYLGTDQSQVQRYLGGKNIAESRLGLLMNGLLKVPMQFFILSIGVLLFVFYQFNSHPTLFNAKNFIPENKKEQYLNIDERYQSLQVEKRKHIEKLTLAGETQKAKIAADLKNIEKSQKELRKEAAALAVGANQAENMTEEQKKQANKLLNKDLDYVFITYVTDYLPHGLIGLLISVIISAAMSSASSELNALGSTTVVDIYNRFLNKGNSETFLVLASKAITIAWGIFAILFSLFAERLENLIQAVNIVGSLVYGTVLGIFMTAFYLKQVRGNAVFWAAIATEFIVVLLFWFDAVAFLWLNPIGCLLVLFFAQIFSLLRLEKS
jgi:Na+/proline symporter